MRGASEPLVALDTHIPKRTRAHTHTHIHAHRSGARAPHAQWSSALDLAKLGEIVVVFGLLCVRLLSQVRLEVPGFLRTQVSSSVA